MLAKASGPRQVGYALHALHEGLDVPWHRVVNAQGRISLQGASAVTQRLMLIREGVPVSESGRMDLKQVGWTPRRPAR
jgi:methylated-DNA-protein-cysteine methyltransferase-like protein